ncbi:MAG: flippase-like domain-containing protein [Anaerolineae bacterium]|nr:flippase-like domain-containing protein [Anaerolineae bacterium]
MSKSANEELVHQHISEFRSPPPPSLRSSASSLLRWCLGLAVGVLCVWLSLRGLDFAQVWASIHQVHIGWLLASLGSVVMVALLKAIRWWFLFPDHYRPASWRRAFSVLLTGQMVNVLIPVRLGEVVRIGLMVQESVPPGVTLSTIVVEKSLELLALGLLLSLTLPSAVLPDWFPISGGLGMGLSGLALLVGLIGVWVLRRWLQQIAARILGFRDWLPQVWRDRLLRLIDHVLGGLEALTHYKSALPVLGLTALVWFFSILTMLLMFISFRLVLPWYAGIVLSLALTLSNLVPQPPAMVGVVGAVTVITLYGFGVEQTVSVALGLLLNVAMVSPIVLLGGWMTWLRFASLGHLPWRERWVSSFGLKKRERN